MHSHQILHAFESSTKISKAQEGFDVREIIEGIEKGTENRYYGQGVEHLRLWAASLNNPKSYVKNKMNNKKLFSNKNLIKDIKRYGLSK